MNTFLWFLAAVIAFMGVLYTVGTFTTLITLSRLQKALGWGLVQFLLVVRAVASVLIFFVAYLVAPL